MDKAQGDHDNNLANLLKRYGEKYVKLSMRSPCLIV